MEGFDCTYHPDRPAEFTAIAGGEPLCIHCAGWEPIKLAPDLAFA